MATQTRRLPLYIAVVAFVVYGATLGGGLTLNGLPLAAKLAGWAPAPMVGQPLLWLVTLPLRALPAAWVAMALKLFAAALAAAILGLLARTVQLLPWDHSWQDTNRLAIHLPILAACVVCGLEFNYWQEATSNCGELLDLLLVAAVIWVLLEYNVRQERRWLDAATVLWGVGMAENWLMLVLGPVFIAAVLALERMNFFRWRFILRMALLGLAGFSLYAVLPFANGLLPHGAITLGQAWVASLHQTKTIVVQLFHVWRVHRLLVVAVTIYFLLPTLPLLVRMRDEGTYNKAPLDRSQTWLFRALRLALLLACCWLAFDPAPGARQLLRHDLPNWPPMLTFDYLTALGAALLLGNLLLIPYIPCRDPHRRSGDLSRTKQLTGTIAAAGLAVVTAGLLVRNAPAIVHSNFHTLEQFGDLAVKSLPAGRGVILSDYGDRLIFFQAALARSSRAKDWLAVDTQALPFVGYREQLERQQPTGWLTQSNRHELSLLETRSLLEQVAVSNRLFYLHPSLGAYFETFHLVPTGIIFEMKLRGTDPLDLPPWPDAALAANEQFWTDHWDKDLRAVAQPNAVAPAHQRSPKRTLGINAVPREQDLRLGMWISIPLEAWAVTLQQQGWLRQAQTRFAQALLLNTNNFCARIGLTCNTNLQAGKPMGLGDVARINSQLGSPARLQNLIIEDGPIEDPTLDYIWGMALFENRLKVQAAEQLERAGELATNSPTLQVALANVYNQLQMPGRSRPLIDRTRKAMAHAPPNSTLDLDLALMESYSWLLQTNVAHARAVLQSVVTQHPDDRKITGHVIDAYLAYNDYTDALQVVDLWLARAPDDPAGLNAKAMILFRGGKAAEAIPVYDQLLTLTNLQEVRVDRAFARIANQDYATAKKELLELQEGRLLGNVNFGLALLAEHDADTNLARRYLQLCLSNTPPDLPLWRQANAKLLRLQPPAAAK